MSRIKCKRQMRTNLPGNKKTVEMEKWVNSILSSRQNLATFLTVAILLSACQLPAVARDRPNVILIMTDDQGYGDLACHGNPVIETPNLDRLYAESVRFTNFHVDPTCSPTRGALMSGKYSHRAKVWHTIAGGNHLRASEMTMSDAFQTSGYRTGMFGKWHATPESTSD